MQCSGPPVSPRLIYSRPGDWVSLELPVSEHNFAAMYDTLKAWFLYVGKIPDGRGFYLLPTIPDFANISDIRKKLSQIFPIGGLEPSNLGDW